ncbi:MAG: hypothetical protein FJW97_07560 [Actinobacteria bacterium]|nr:hypothetical protein [Actinomycetota bacterium]
MPPRPPKGSGSSPRTPRSGGSRSSGATGKSSDRRPAASSRDAKSGPRSGAPRAGGSGKSGDRRVRDESPRTPRGPRIPDEAHVEDLDPAVANELRTLPEDLGERVGRLLVAADIAVSQGEETQAREFTAEAKRLAGRVAVVREAFAITSYLCGDYAEALSELRAVRRMRGGDEFVPMMADCERALGKPEKALELLRGIALGRLDPVTRVELLIVMAGARADMDQVDAALVTLETPDLTGCPDGEARARMQFAYADLWERAGDRKKAREWFGAAVKSDPEDVIGAAERLE